MLLAEASVSIHTHLRGHRLSLQCTTPAGWALARRETAWRIGKESLVGRLLETPALEEASLVRIAPLPAAGTKVSRKRSTQRARYLEPRALAQVSIESVSHRLSTTSLNSYMTLGWTFTRSVSRFLTLDLPKCR